MLQAAIEKALSKYREDGTMGKMKEDYTKMAEDAKKLEENSQEIDKMLEDQLGEMSELTDSYEERKKKRLQAESAGSNEGLFKSKIDEDNPWTIHELYDELQGSEYNTEELIRHKKRKRNGYPSALGKEVIEMQVEDRTLMKSTIHKCNPWHLPDIYEEMGPDDNSVEFIERKRESLRKEMVEKAAARRESTKSPELTTIANTTTTPHTPTSSASSAAPSTSATPPRAFCRKSTTTLPRQLSEPPHAKRSPVECIEIDDDSGDESKRDEPKFLLNFPHPEKGNSILAKWKENCWFKGTLVDTIKDQRGQEKFKVRLERERDTLQIVVSGMQIASIHSAKPSELTIGRRIVGSQLSPGYAYIKEFAQGHTGKAVRLDLTEHEGGRALFREEEADDCLYAGVIAEMPMTTNHGRYLVFFDDGYVQYMHRKRIHLVYTNSKNVWEDVEELMSEFVKDYLEQYPFRPLVRVVADSEVKTEFQGKWLRAKVLEVDSSLVLMQYANDLQKEWLYRGSTRLEPVYRFVMMHRYGQGVTPGRVQQNVKRVEYSLIKPHQYLPVSERERKQMARKSTGSASLIRKVQVNEEEPEIIDLEREDEEEPDQETEPMMQATSDRNQKTTYETHTCSSACVASAWPVEPGILANLNPLMLPQLYGWSREFMKPHSTTIKRQVIYKTPCGKCLRSLEEIDLYLTETKVSYLAIDHFDLSPYVFILTRKLKNPKQCHIDLPDISNGEEPTPVACVNEYDESPPPVFKYVANRKELDGNKINMDPGFLLCCDCTDNCMDKSKCACQQLTIESTKVIDPHADIPEAGYVQRRLLQSCPTGVYECNHLCKCSSQCHNKVVQNGLQLRLQVFKTERKGWGIRCVDDVPKGSFVCIYSGHIWSEEEANDTGKEGRDVYFAELDHIEVVEKLKEGYESDVPSDSSEDDKKRNEPDWDFPSPPSSDDEFLPGVKPPKKKTPTPQARKTSQDTNLSPTGSTKLVLRRHSTGETTAVGSESWSVTFSGEKGTNWEESPVKYGYNTNPGKVLDQGQVEAFRQRQQARKQRRSKGQQPRKTLFESKVSEFVNSEDPGSEESDSSSVVSMESSGLKSYEFASKLMELSSKYEADRAEKAGEVEDAPEGESQSPAVPAMVTKKGKRDGDEQKRGVGKNSRGKEKFPPTRSYFGEEHCYIMDALEAGNLGRFFNHSCSPNLFVQNVFVDTHDLRFPWVAFFAARYLRAGTELTWDYAYEIGSVPGKELKCYCGSRYCKGRLL